MYDSHEDVDSDSEKNSKEREQKLNSNPDIDRGWAWMIVFSSFLVHILIMGSQMALGILNMEWLEEFSQSRGLTAWVSSLNMGITLIVGRIPYCCYFIPVAILIKYWCIKIGPMQLYGVTHYLSGESFYTWDKKYSITWWFPYVILNIFAQSYLINKKIIFLRFIYGNLLEIACSD